MSLSSPPSHDVDWFAFRRHTRDEATFVRARTWFAARSLAMAELDCGPDDIEVKDWPFGGVEPKAGVGAKREQLTAELKAATETPKASKALDALLDVPAIRSKADAEALFGKGSYWVQKVDGFLRRGRASGPVLAVKVK